MALKINMHFFFIGQVCCEIMEYFPLIIKASEIHSKGKKADPLSDKQKAHEEGLLAILLLHVRATGIPCGRAGYPEIENSCHWQRLWYQFVMVDLGKRTKLMLIYLHNDVIST